MGATEKTDLAITLPRLAYWGATMTRYDPAEIASQLVQEHGLDEAIEAATEEIQASQRIGDFYALSVWREVRRHLQSRRRDGNGRSH